jgi:hypothetical protein
VLRREELDDPLGLGIDLSGDDHQLLLFVQGVREIDVKGLPVERRIPRCRTEVPGDSRGDELQVTFAIP